MGTGPELLKRYLKSEGLTLAQFAERVGTSKGLVAMWRQGSRSPGLTFAFRMQSATGGRIPATSWLDESVHFRYPARTAPRRVAASRKTRKLTREGR